MSAPASVVVRVDGSRKMGHGHVFRTLVLADELCERGASVTFACRALDGAPLERIRTRGHTLHVLETGPDETGEEEAVARLARDRGADWLVVDRYATTPAFYRTLRAHGLRILAIDDIAQHAFPVDVLVNQNADAPGLSYDTDTTTERLLGPRYALVAPAYRRARPAAPRTSTGLRRVLVTMGGGDAGNATGVVLDAFDAVDTGTPLALHLVVGRGSPHADALRERARDHRHFVTVDQDLPDLVAAMQAANACICAGGSTAWELCCLGVPMGLLPIADNQLGVVAALEQLGCGVRLGDARAPERTAPAALSEAIAAWLGGSGLPGQSAAAWELVDGRGVERIASRMADRCR